MLLQGKYAEERTLSDSALAALTVQGIHSIRLKRFVGILITVLGLFTLFKTSSGP